jgi:DNA polymerase epsilon subunit 1
VRFPKLPGSHLVMTNPALEFVKQIVHVLQLDARFRDEANVLRRVGSACSLVESP